MGLIRIDYIYWTPLIGPCHVYLLPLLSLTCVGRVREPEARTSRTTVHPRKGGCNPPDRASPRSSPSAHSILPPAMAEARQNSAVDTPSEDSLQDGIVATRQEVADLRAKLVAIVEKIGGIDKVKASCTLLYPCTWMTPTQDEQTEAHQNMATDTPLEDPIRDQIAALRQEVAVLRMTLAAAEEKFESIDKAKVSYTLHYHAHRSRSQRMNQNLNLSIESSLGASTRIGLRPSITINLPL